MHRPTLPSRSRHLASSSTVFRLSAIVGEVGKSLKQRQCFVSFFLAQGAKSAGCRDNRDSLTLPRFREKPLILQPVIMYDGQVYTSQGFRGRWNEAGGYPPPLERKEDRFSRKQNGVSMKPKAS